jgi:hypothetical protein
MKIRADMIKKGLSEKHAQDFFITEVKNGPTWAARKGELLKLDGLAIKKSWTQPCFTGYEVKVSRNDFLNDEKWPAYMDYCHRFYFACPKGLIQPEELQDNVGLLWYDESYDKAGNLYTRKKALFRNIEISHEMLYYIVLSRIDDERHPFFSSQREYYQAWVNDKMKRYELGHMVSNKMLEEISRLNEAKIEAERIAEKHKENTEILTKITQIMRDAGINTRNIGSRWYSWEEELRQELTAGVNEIGLKLVEQIETDARKLVEMFKNGK